MTETNIMILTEKLHLLRIDFEIPIGPGRVMPRFVNVIIVLGNKITLIDTGVKGCEEKIFAYLKECNRDPSEIGTIILSHSHPDHIGSAARIKELTRCEVSAHPLDRPWIENIEKQNEERPVPGFFSLVDQPVKVDTLLNDAESLKLDYDTTAKIIHAPGHSNGSINIYFHEDRILFTADSIPLKNDIPNYSNYPDLRKSLERIKSDKTYRMLLTSWTPPFSEAAEIQNLILEGENYLQKIDRIVKSAYMGRENAPLTCCRSVIEQLGLPPFLASPLVDQALRSHLTDKN